MDLASWHFELKPVENRMSIDFEGELVNGEKRDGHDSQQMMS
jgi:hypothetical protein